jgi:prepilin-type N-terminal cleavage/methylation domain-containing protein
VKKIGLLNNSSAFTLVELIIVIIILGILTGLVTNAFGGLQDDARDSERKTDIQALSSDLEAYYSDYGKYPSVSNLDDAAWVDEYLTGIEQETLVDARGNKYVYTPVPSGCDNTTVDCTRYTLTADLEDDGYGAEDSDSNTADLLEKSIHNGQ